MAAIIREDLDSRTGQEWTKDRTTRLKRDFMVTVDGVHDRAEIVIQVPSAIDSTKSPLKAIQEGDQYPEFTVGGTTYKPKAFARRFENLSGGSPLALVQLVRVHYEPDDSSDDKWQFTFESGQETETVRFDVNGKPIGTRVYKAVKEFGPDFDEAGEEISSGFEAPHFANTVSGRVPLLRQGDDHVEFQPVQRTKTVSSFRLARHIDDLPENYIDIITNAMNKINEGREAQPPTKDNPHGVPEKKFFGFPGRTVKFIAASVNIVPGSNDEARGADDKTPADVVLNFRVNHDKDGWDHVIFETWKDDKGRESFIRRRVEDPLLPGEEPPAPEDTREKLTRKLYFETDFQAQLLDRLAPSSRAPEPTGP